MTTALTSGVAVYDQVNPFNWKWYSISLADEQDGQQVLYNAVVTVDSEDLVSVAGTDVWATFDVLIVNGTLPGNAQTGEPGPVSIGNPYCWIDEECSHDVKLAFSQKSRVTASFGFNHTAPGGMLPPLTQLVVGVREAGEGTTAVGFTLRVTRLPRVLVDDTVIESAVAPCEGVDELSCRQYFTVPVSGYDILELRLERTGDNLTVAGSGGTVSNGGRGLVGDLYVSTDEMFSLPPPLTYDQRRQVFNVTPSVEVGYFCTLSQQAGTYTVAVVAGTESDGGFGAELLTSAAEIAIDAGVARQGRGRFALHVRHARFQDGAMAAHESRPGCVGFGQTRNYTVTTSGMGDANLFTKISGANVSALRARCDGCDWVTATPPISSLSASPCSMRNSTTWQVQVSLADYVSATLNGVSQAEFMLSTELQNASIYHGEVVEPRSLGGRGYVCCGALQTYVVPDVPRTHAVSVKLNVTAGHVRAGFLKHGQCAIPGEDIDGAICTGLCEITWLTVYDEFYGTMQHTQESTVAVPFGPDAWLFNPATTKRRQGDWYISLQALPGVAAQYRMEVSLLDPPRAPEVYSCSRFAGFCPKGHYHGGFITTVESGASPPPWCGLELHSTFRS